MDGVLNHPLLVCAFSFVALALSTRVGVFLGKTRRTLEKRSRNDFSTILLATLTLNALIIGFSFSMAINRYEQRRSYEETEASAIGTEYLRADFLPAPDALKVRALLRSYLEQRIAYYRARDERQLQGLSGRTAQLQTDLWGLVRSAGAAQPTSVVALVVAGMNDVLGSQSGTQAVWWNRIPKAAWLLMLTIAIIGNLLLGYGAQNPRAETLLLMVLPCVLSISFLLIADIESPRGGLIRVDPQNLTGLAASLTEDGGVVVGGSTR
jgi:hypothetical protein